MVVSFDIYVVIGVVQLVLAWICILLTFLGEEKMWNKVFRLILSISITTLNLVLIPIEMQREQSYTTNIILACICFIYAVAIVVDIILHKKGIKKD